MAVMRKHSTYFIKDRACQKQQRILAVHYQRAAVLHLLVFNYVFLLNTNNFDGSNHNHSMLCF